MVVTDIFLPDFSGGARRTIETARILNKLGYRVIILCNRRSEDSRFEKFENFEIFRVKMIDIGEKTRNALGKIITTIKRVTKKNKSSSYSPKVFDSHLDVKTPITFREKLKDFYRHKFPIHKFIKWFPAIFRILTLIRKKEINIVYERGPSYGAGVFAANLTGRPSIIDFIDVMYWNWALRRCTRILSYFTNYQIPEFIERSKIDIVYTSADILHFNINDPKLVKNKNKSGALGVYIGGYYHWHGLEYLVQAMALLKKTKKQWLAETGLNIQLVGRGEHYNYIKNLIDELDVGELFDLHDRIPFEKLPQFLFNADFCISLNTGDALGLKVFEYMAMSKPVLISNIDLVPIFLSENVVYAVNPTKPGEIAERIIHIINHPDERQKKGENARKLVEQKFSWDQHGRNIKKTLIESLKSYQEAKQ